MEFFKIKNLLKIDGKIEQETAASDGALQTIENRQSERQVQYS